MSEQDGVWPYSLQAIAYNPEMLTCEIEDDEEEEEEEEEEETTAESGSGEDSSSVGHLEMRMKMVCVLTGLRH